MIKQSTQRQIILMGLSAIALGVGVNPASAETVPGASSQSQALPLSTGQKFKNLQELVSKQFQVQKGSAKVVEAVAKNALGFVPMTFNGDRTLLF